jgi:hypothetical protein
MEVNEVDQCIAVMPRTLDPQGYSAPRGRTISAAQILARLGDPT